MAPQANATASAPGTLSSPLVGSPRASSFASSNSPTGSPPDTQSRESTVEPETDPDGAGEDEPTPKPRFIAQSSFTESMDEYISACAEDLIFVEVNLLDGRSEDLEDARLGRTALVPVKEEDFDYDRATRFEALTNNFLLQCAYSGRSVTISLKHTLDLPAGYQGYSDEDWDPEVSLGPGAAPPLTIPNPWINTALGTCYTTALIIQGSAVTVPAGTSAVAPSGTVASNNQNPMANGLANTTTGTLTSTPASSTQSLTTPVLASDTVAVSSSVKASTNQAPTTTDAASTTAVVPSSTAGPSHPSLLPVAPSSITPVISTATSDSTESSPVAHGQSNVQIVTSQAETAVALPSGGATSIASQQTLSPTPNKAIAKGSAAQLKRKAAAMNNEAGGRAERTESAQATAGPVPAPALDKDVHAYDSDFESVSADRASKKAANAGASTGATDNLSRLMASKPKDGC